MKLLALLEDPLGPSARLRFEPFARELERAGVSIRRVALAHSGPRRWRQLSGADAHDVVYLQRRLLQPFESWLLRRRSRRLVVDLDDAVWRRPRPPFESWTRRLRARALLARADVVLAGSRTLAEELRGLGIAATVVPAPAPLRAIARAPRAAAHPPTLVWIGQPPTFPYLRGFSRAWQHVRAAIPAARLIVIGSGVASDPALPEAEHRAWSEEAERVALAEADVGLAPLPDDPWTRGKCGARLLTYLASGLPAVASPVGAQAELAEEVGGIALAVDARAFGDAAVGLLADPEQRARLRAAALTRLAEVRTVEAIAPAFLRALLGAGAAASVAGSGGGG